MYVSVSSDTLVGIKWKGPRPPSGLGSIRGIGACTAEGEPSGGSHIMR